MENPSFSVSGNVGRMNFTFIVEDSTEDDFGQWAKDEETSGQGYFDDEKNHVSGQGTRLPSKF